MSRFFLLLSRLGHRDKTTLYPQLSRNTLPPFATLLPLPSTLYPPPSTLYPPPSTLYPLPAILLLLTHCANPIPPEGGPKDETPPKVDTALSTPNYQTRFQRQRIEITFDEWVNLDDVFNQVIVSPPLTNRFQATLKGRTLRFDFDETEELRPNATYTINFGEAIKDLTERNPAENLRFVFSTGDVLDSLRLNGRIVDATTGEPVEKALFMLYENRADTVVRKERPFYFGKTNKEGLFSIENIRADTFKAFALLDADLNYLYNQASEKIGFPDSFLVVQTGRELQLNIQLFEEQKPLKVQEEMVNISGLVKAVFNQRPPDSIELRATLPEGNFWKETEGDTLRIWYAPVSDQPWYLFLTRGEAFRDTLAIKTDGKVKSPMSGKFLPASRAKSVRIHPDKPLELGFNLPVGAFDTAKISLLEDSVLTRVTPEIGLDSTSIKTLRLRYPWKEGISYRLKIMPGGVNSIFNQALDTFLLDIQGDQRKNYGDISLTVDSLGQTMQYLIELLSPEGKVLAQKIHKGSSSFSHKFTALPPGTYKLRIITDWNGNGKWDTGVYDLRLQPEPIFLKELEQLRANWELEVQIGF